MCRRWSHCRRRRRTRRGTTSQWAPARFSSFVHYVQRRRGGPPSLLPSHRTRRLTHSSATPRRRRFCSSRARAVAGLATLSQAAVPHQLDLADACHLLMQRPQPSCYDLASRTQFIAGQPVVLQPTPEGLVKGDELSPKMQAAGAAGGCCIDGQLQRATQSRCGDFSADAGGRASHGQTNPILLWVDLLVALLI